VTGDLRITAEPIAKIQLVAISLRSQRDEVEVMGASSRIWLAEPVHLVGQVWRMEIIEVGQRPKASTGGREVADADEDVDDWLCFEVGDRGAADVVNAAAGPLADCLLERRSLQLELSGPAWVGRYKLDGFVSGHREVAPYGVRPMAGCV
jgi:hypothetical protein